MLDLLPAQEEATDTMALGGPTMRQGNAQEFQKMFAAAVVEVQSVLYKHTEIMAEYGFQGDISAVVTVIIKDKERTGIVDAELSQSMRFTNFRR